MYSVQATAKLSKRTVNKIEKMATFLETLSPKKFHMDYWALGRNAASLSNSELKNVKKGDDLPVECGTTACICGWMPSVFPNSRDLRLIVERCQYDPSSLCGDLIYKGELNEDAAAHFLGISNDDAYNLFVNAAVDSAGINTPKKAAKMLRNFVKRAEKVIA